MAKRITAIKQAAAELASRGKYRKAYRLYTQLAKREPATARWQLKKGDMALKLGQRANAVAAYALAAERLAELHHDESAIAVCHLIHRIDPKHPTMIALLRDLNAGVPARGEQARRGSSGRKPRPTLVAHVGRALRRITGVAFEATPADKPIAAAGTGVPDKADKAVKPRRRVTVERVLASSASPLKSGEYQVEFD